MKLFCKHDWEIVVKETMPSMLDTKNINNGGNITVPAWVAQRKIIIILKCKKCGKLNKTIETNP